MPEFKLKDSLASNEIIIADLMSHRIGFETFQGDFTYWTSNLSRADVIHKMALIDALYSFRTKWGYCNAAFLTAGELIPKITGKSWEETVKEKILTPLKMNRTLMLSQEFKTASNAAFPFTIVNDKLTELPIPYIDNLAPAGSISSCVKDMATWLMVQLLFNKPSFSLENYTGTYTNEVYGDIAIKLEKNNLNIYFSHHPNLIGKLEHLKNDGFLCTYSNPTMGIVEIPFKVENEKVTGLTLRVADFVEFTPSIFVKNK